MKLNELEYKALNIMDEVCTVEVAFSPKTNTIHIFDVQQAVEPEYNFATKQYGLSDSFFKMAELLATKGYIAREMNESERDWIERMEWRFYSSKQTIKIYKNSKMSVLQATSLKGFSDEKLLSQNFYRRYVEKLNV